jgi:hypothetical protein
LLHHSTIIIEEILFIDLAILVIVVDKSLIIKEGQAVPICS